MYKIIGGDQKEYGPVTFEQLAQWVRDNRANAQTLVQKEGGPWVPLGSLPEFASMLADQPSPAAPGPSAIPSGALPASGPIGGPSALNPEFAQMRAREMVQGPATGLIVTSVLGIIAVLTGLAFTLVGNTFQPPPGDVPEEFRQWMEMAQRLQSPAFAIADALIKLAIAGITLLAATRMRNLQSFPLVVTATILTAFPCTSPCCCIGLPVGIWVLVVLFKPEVRSAFR
jgi:hypothetical protein